MSEIDVVKIDDFIKKVQYDFSVKNYIKYAIIDKKTGALN